ncbi:MAG: alpha/beta hydrolase [Bacteroidota bacterium]
METETIGYNLTTTLNNFTFSYDDLGEGRIPIIFLHGYPFDKSMWHNQLEFLKDSHRVIACDIRGFGKSRDEESPLCIDMFSDDLIKFMDQLKIENAIICGLSMGGFIALNVQKKIPNRIKALILCDTQCVADNPETKAKRHEIIKEIKLNGPSNFNETFLKSVFHKDSLSSKKELVEELRKVVFANSQTIIINGLYALAGRSETCSTLCEIAVPTLIICGRQDEVTPLVQSEFLNATIKRSILRVINNAGHVSNLEQPIEFNAHLSEFLAELN